MKGRDQHGPQRGRKPVDNETLSRRMDAFEEQLAKNTAVCEPLAEEIKVILRTVTNINAEVGYAPAHETRGDRPSLRDRVHTLENQTSPVVVEAAVRKAINEWSVSVWETWKTRLLVVAAACGVVGAIFGGMLAVVRALQAFGWA